MIKFKKDWPLKSFQKKSLALHLVGSRIFLKPPTWYDYQKWLAVRSRNQHFLKPFEPKWAKDCLTENFFKNRLNRQHIEMGEGRGVFFLIHHHETQNIIGGINMNNILYGAAHSASLGYWLDKQYIKQGYMFEAANLIIDYAFNTLNLHRLNAACMPENQASINLLLKLGFKEEGLALQYLQINGEWKDHKLFGMNKPA